MRTVILTTFQDNTQANMLKDVLLNEGIVSFMKNETLSSVFPIPAFEIEVSVFEKDYHKALEILEKGFPELSKK